MTIETTKNTFSTPYLSCAFFDFGDPVAVIVNAEGISHSMRIDGYAHDITDLYIQFREFAEELPFATPEDIQKVRDAFKAWLIECGYENDYLHILK